MTDAAHRFCWYELMTSDAPAAQRFYGEVIGWTATDVSQPGAPYALFSVAQGGVGGVLPTPSEATGAGPAWIGYVSVPDVDAWEGRILEAGGMIHRKAADISGVGRFAVVADPGGAVFVIFAPLPASQPPAPEGVLGQAGWRELMAEDLETAWGFYAQVFGWTVVQEISMGPMGIYRLFGTGGEAAAGGMMTKPAQVERAVWRYAFLVDSAEAGSRRVEAAGGAVSMAPHQVPGGQWVVQAHDPQGAFFSLLSDAP